MATANELVTDGLDLVTLPDVYLAVKAVLDDPNSGAGDMARAIETDPALSMRLLRMANSPFFGFAAQVGSVARAVSMLGTLQIHDLVLASSLATTFNRVASEVLDVPQFWRSSVRRAVGAKVIGTRCNVIDGDRIFLAGLLCHIGEMVIALREPEKYGASAAAATGQGRSLAEVQREALGFDYAEVGAALVHAWHLPEALQTTVRWHVTPRQAVDFALETAIVHVAAVLTGPDNARIEDAAAQLLNLTDDQLADISVELEQQAAEVLSLLYAEPRKIA